MVTIHPATLADLRDSRSRPWLLDLVSRDIGGGKVDVAQVNSLEVPTTVTALRISGLDQASFEALVAGLGSQVTAIDFWKCPRIADLSALEDLPHLRLVSFYWNQRATRLWDFRRTPHLSGLRFYDFSRLHSLADLPSATSLVELDFGDAVWDTAVFDTLDPLSELKGLHSLTLSAKKIIDGRVEPLAALQQLESLVFSSRQFTMAQIAWLRAHLPDTLRSESLDALTSLSPALRGETKELDVLLNGKRKPFLNSTIDRSRIQKHVAQFDAMVARFREDPSLPPE
ncbi:MAG: hypothetical protein CVT62_03085 [Actinobacteria bacterium HGW-Actinobacteria-2]|nr:MAG: hypothetical protein CVT62_03085 [Actinobacteria bacterium HGW-Actinobacteria-2]